LSFSFAENFLARPVLVAIQNPPVVSRLVLRKVRRDIKVCIETYAVNR
jgi:hypothetical protein